jgi:hypothetical protein
MIGEREAEGFAALTLASPGAGGIEAAFVPRAGMGCSLRHRGEELLGQRGGLGFDFAADADLMKAFPFPHELQIQASVTGSTLAISTTVRATG